MSSFRIDFDYKEVMGMYMILDRLGKSPQKALNKGTSKAAQIVKRSVKGLAPDGKTHQLRKNIVTKTERSSKRGKKVRQTTMKGGAEANAIFQKPILNPGILGGESPYAYYPSSMEYGFLARAKGGGVQYIEGRHFMRGGAESASEPAKKAMIETMTKEMDKIWKGG